MHLYPFYLVCSIALALLALAVAAATFLRLGAWRREDLAREAAKDTKASTEVTINQVDQTSRDGVKSLIERFNAYSAGIDQTLVALRARIEAEATESAKRTDVLEGELRNSIQKLDSRLATELTDQGKQLAGLQEATRHLPTQADLSAMRTVITELTGQERTNAATIDGLARLLSRIDTSVQRIEEHHFRDR